MHVYPGPGVAEARSEAARRCSANSAASACRSKGTPGRPKDNWGYRSFTDQEKLTEAYLEAGTPGPAVGPGTAVHDGWLSLISAIPLGDQWGGRQVLLAWAVTALAAVGLVAARRSRPVLAMTVASLLLAVVAWGCMIGSPTAYRLGTPWYANGFRLLATLTVPLLVLVGIGVGRLAGLAWVRVTAVSAVLLALLAVPATAICGVLGSRTYSAYSVVTADDRDVYAWLGAHVVPGERVLNDSHDGSMWMYPLADAAPVFGPKSDLWTTPAWQDRWYLLQHIADIASDPRAARIAHELSVRYVAVGDRVVYGEARQLDPNLLLDARGLREVYRSGSARVFEIVASA